MKRLIRNLEETLNLDISIKYVVQEEVFQKVAATDIKPILIDKDKQLIDVDAKEGFDIFVQNVFEIITAYDFEILDKFSHTSKSFPYTTEYRWVAHRTEIDADNVLKFIKLRISDHVQSFSPERQRELSKEDRAQAESLKMPKSKKVQRFVVDEIVVNSSACQTYEEALHLVELKVREWLKSRQIDLTEYGDSIW